MADIVGLVATILQLIDLVGRSRVYIKGFRDAPQEQQRLLSEIQDVEALVDQLNRRLETGHLSEWPGGMEQVREPLLQMKATMERLTSQLNVTRPISKVSSRLSWPLWGKEEVREGLETIERFKGLLAVWLGMSTWDCAQDVLFAVKDLGKAQRTNHEYITKAIQLSTQELKGVPGSVMTAVMDSKEAQQIGHNQIYGSITHLSQRQEMYYDSAERDMILDWLSPINSFLRQADISSMQQSGTGKWFVQGDLMKQWRSGKPKTVWCRGMREFNIPALDHSAEGSTAGAGKTVLASMVVDDLRTIPDSQNTGVAVIYLNHKETEIQTPSNVLAALWRQLTVGKPLTDVVRQLYAKHRERRTRPTLEDIFFVLYLTLSELSSAFIIIDALDEYPETQRHILLHHLSPLPSAVNLLITSRPHINIKHIIADAQIMEVRATEDDIRRYVDAQITNSTRLGSHIRNYPELREEIETNIVQRSDGMFLLAKLHVESLATKHTLKAVRKCLTDMPGDLRRTYDEVMQRINRRSDDDRDLAYRVLSWVSNAKRLLRPSKLREALAVEPGTAELDPENLLDLDTIVSVCEGLIMVNAEDDRVCLIHYTTQSYLDSIQATYFTQAHSQIATTCITYLLFDSFAPNLHSALDNIIFSPTPPTHHLLTYALNYGITHARGGPESHIVDVIAAFLARRSRWLDLWNRVYYHNKIPESATKLWIAAFFDLRDTAGDLITTEGLDAEAVYAASANGHAEMVETLIAAGAQVNTLEGYHGSALQVATVTGNVDMVRLLIHHNADVNFQTMRHNSALYEASRRGYESIVRLLIENGAHVNMQTEEHGTALQMASHGGHQEIVRLLLANGADVNVHSEEQLTGTALHMASIEGHQNIIRILIEHGADVNFQTKERGSALYGASLMQNVGAVALLIEHGADVNAKGPDGTALQVAAADGNEKIVRLLIAHGAHVNTQGPNGSALQAAASAGHESIVHVLFEHGADRRKLNLRLHSAAVTLAGFFSNRHPYSWIPEKMPRLPRTVEVEHNLYKYQLTTGA
ncbi:hypothetical protein DFH06DRAFT_1331042 [Mycena polygramma]|nr:hypothetical protein DFH06DRAFT_1331042 [Mycena polygramma]